MKSALAATSLLLPLLLATNPVPSRAQGVMDELEFLRDALRSERRTLVEANLKLSDGEAKAFWPLYAEYEAARRKAGDERVKLLTELARNLDTLTDEQATGLLERALGFQEERIELRRAYVPKFAGVLSGRQLARFYQIEIKLDTALDFELARLVPLVH